MVSLDFILFIGLCNLNNLLYIWWPTNKIGAEIALFTSLTVLWYIWWPSKKVGAEIALLPV